jgi:hypothetical protein
MANSVAKYVLDNPGAIKEMTKDIRRWIKKSCTEAVNAAAFAARENLAGRIKNEFYVRTPFLTSGKALFVTKAPFGKTESLADIKASVGFTEAASFMKRQDMGGWHHAAQAGKRLRIFTDAAREGGTKAGPVQRGYGYTKNTRKMAIPLITKGISHKSKQVRRAAVAYKSGMLMYFNRSLFRIRNFKKTSDGVRFEKTMIINRAYERTFTPAHNFFMPECDKAAQNMQELFNEAMDRNMDRH